MFLKESFVIKISVRYKRMYNNIGSEKKVGLSS